MLELLPLAANPLAESFGIKPACAALAPAFAASTSAIAPFRTGLFFLARRIASASEIP
jgi:hypothetical protein